MSSRQILAATVVCTLSTYSALAADRPSSPPEELETLSTVIVTAGKIDRSLLDTATSVSVLSARDLERRPGLSTTKDVLEYTPNITIAGTGNQAPTVRGTDGTGAAKGADAFFAGSRPRLNVQIDGRPASYNEVTFADTALWDVDHIEILRGAQSTLQGRNAIAGTIVTRTKDPTFTPESAIRVGGGNDEQRRYSGMISGPITDDSVAFRLAADYLTRHTFVDGFGGFPTVEDPGEFEALNVRGKLLFESQSIDGLRTLVTLNHSDYTGPQTETIDRPFERRHSDFVFEPVFQPKTTSLILDTSYAFAPDMSFDGVLSATDLNVKRKSPVGAGIVNIDGHEYVFEPRVNFQGEGRGSGVAGVYVFRSQQDEAIDFPTPQTFDDSITTLAAFGEGTWPLTETVDLIAGARYEREKHERHGGDQSLVRISLDETYEAFLPKVGVAWHVQQDTTLGVVASRGYNGGGAGFTFDEGSGVFTNYQYDPEYATTLELFGRKQMLEGRLGLTANVFYSNYHDMQLTFDLTPNDQADFSFVVRNADRARSYGAELSADFAVDPSLRLFASVGLLKAEITRYPDSGFQGHEQPFAPSLSAAAGVTWNNAGWDASLSARYSGSYFSDLDNESRGEVDPYFVANAQLGYSFSRVRIYGFVDNLFDSDKLLALYPGDTREEDTADILPPRTYWAGVQVSF